MPVTAASYTATGNTVNFTLNFAPPVGTNLTVVKNTGLGFISGQFSNLAHGQFVTLTYNKAAYKFVANYYGGTGNDLVLHWARNKVYAWGQNWDGQLGNGTTTHSNVPVAVAADGILAGKTVTALALGSWGSLALCADGTLAGWGNHVLFSGDSNVPVAVPPTGALAGKTVIAIASGEQYQLALCADGTLVGWGDNHLGQLGNATINFAFTPVAVSTTGVLAGKTVVAIAAGASHCLALCADGTLAAWGFNYHGQLGNDSTVDSNVPVAVTIPPFLAGKTVTAIAAGNGHSMALYSDNTIAAWGSNTFGSLGNGTNTSSSIPVAVKTSGVLSGKTVTGIVTGGFGHCLARCSDGTLAAWGYNPDGQLGNGTTTYTNEPVAVSTNPLLTGKTLTSLAAGYHHSMACCSDGAIAAWGWNYYGVLGNGNFTDSKIPVAVTTSTLGSGERFTTVAGSVMPDHALALAAVPLSNIRDLCRRNHELHRPSATRHPFGVGDTNSHRSRRHSDRKWRDAGFRHHQPADQPRAG
ncbi:MAG: hypothetical protein NTV46_03025 [Verrucomicrobia bacterium]|nr:hypothetical protein [Verrucomicrobiota bacterium]